MGPWRVPHGDRITRGRDCNSVGDEGGGYGGGEATGCGGATGGNAAGGDGYAADGAGIDPPHPPHVEDDVDKFPESYFSKAAARVFDK